MTYIIISISDLVLLVIFNKIIGIDLVKAKFEDRSKTKVVNNFYLETCKHFIDKADYDHITGKVIFFNTWASWCSSRIKEIPILNDLQLQYKDNEKIIFISYCNDLAAAAIPAFIRKRNLELNYRFLNAGEGLRSSLRTILSADPGLPPIDPFIDSVPMNFIIDQNEKILYYKKGALTADDHAIITSILNGL